MTETAAAIEPADVYQKVTELNVTVAWLYRLVGLLCALVVVQILTKVVVFARFYYSQEGFLTRVEKLLGIAETHGNITDRTVRSATTAVTHEVRRKAEEIKAEVPSAVVDEIKQRLPPATPQWTPGDPDRRTGHTPEAFPRPPLPPAPPPPYYPPGAGPG